LVREVIRPALAAGQVVLSDRFYDSTTAYQGYGRELDLQMVKAVIDVAVGNSRPDLTLLFVVSPEVSAHRLLKRQSTLPFMRDRIEEGDRAFFERVANGYQAIAAAEPNRIRKLDASGSVERTKATIWEIVEPLLGRVGAR
jgi:dTMP kinase